MDPAGIGLIHGPSPFNPLAPEPNFAKQQVERDPEKWDGEDQDEPGERDADGAAGHYHPHDDDHHQRQIADKHQHGEQIV